MKKRQRISSLTLIMIVMAGIAASTWAQDDGEYGDAPEGALAYPALGVVGSFPTCKTVGPATFIYHQPWQFQFFGPMKDFEFDGNAGSCPLFAPYDLDECFADADAGLIMPAAFTIVGSNVVPCAGQPSALGVVCTAGVWGGNIDIHVVNTHNLTAYVNVLADWNQDGIWAPSTQVVCNAPEYILIDWPVPGGYAGPLSGLMPPQFQIGGNVGHAWLRFSVTERPLNNPQWDGSGSFEDGETEDYLLLIDAPVATENTSWGALKSIYR